MSHKAAMENPGFVGSARFRREPVPSAPPNGSGRALRSPTRPRTVEDVSVPPQFGADIARKGAPTQRRRHHAFVLMPLSWPGWPEMGALAGPADAPEYARTPRAKPWGFRDALFCSKSHARIAPSRAAGASAAGASSSIVVK